MRVEILIFMSQESVMAVLYIATGRGIELYVILCFLLLAFSSSAVASDNPVFNVKSIRCSRGMKVLDRVKRKLAAVPAPEPAISANGSVPSPSKPLSPSTPPNRRPALITPSGNAPGQDLPPMLLSPPPVVVPPTTTSAPALASKRSKVAVILGVTFIVAVLLLVSLSAAAFIKPEWLPCCRGRRSRLTQYERHVQT